MKETRYYMVAGHVFSVTVEEGDLKMMTNYEPFVCEVSVPCFTLSIEDGAAIDYSEDMRQQEEGQEIVCGETADGRSVFDFRFCTDANGVLQTAGCLVCSADYHEAILILTGVNRKFAIDSALMVLYAQATADKGTALFHSAVVSHRGKGYMFLGKSGTGKSTHARLWLQHIDGTELMNDDNPIVRDGIVYGSPWSGKTPCYRRVDCPLGGIVLLSQAPYNRIRRLEGIEAYAALLSSISGMRWNRHIADGLHQTENSLAMRVPVWHLECLPDEEAAILCSSTIEQSSVNQIERR